MSRESEESGGTDDSMSVENFSGFPPSKHRTCTKACLQPFKQRFQYIYTELGAKKSKKQAAVSDLKNITNTKRWQAVCQSRPLQSTVREFLMNLSHYLAIPCPLNLTGIAGHGSSEKF